MKKLVVAILGAGVLLAGGLYLTRRRPAELPVDEGAQQVFRAEAAESGLLIHYDDPRTPLRALRWLPPVQEGTFVAQVNTQGDRQQISIFRDSAFLDSYLVPKPQGVRDGFFRMAELRQALVADGDAAVLLYMVPGSGELPLALALDLRTRTVRWTHRAMGERLAMTEGAIYLYGPRTSPVRLPLALAAGETNSPAGARSSARIVELPPEIQEVAELLPTGSWSFLVAHKGGLSAYLGSKGWLHQPVPEGDPGLFKNVGPALCGGGGKFWWQPFPGRVIQVQADGTPRGAWTPAELPTAPPFARDASLLHLLGAAPDGRLWFDLSVPAEPPRPESSPEAEPRPGEPEGSAAPQEPEGWAAYAGRGLGRIYCWDPQKRVLRGTAWSALKVPPGMPRPEKGVKGSPGAGALLLENGSSAWLLPLAAIPAGEPTATLKPGS